MCGRFTLRTPARRLAELFGGRAEDYGAPRYNIAPGRAVLALRSSAPGSRDLVRLQWGLVPSWAKDAAIGNRLINARAESVAEKPAFRAAFRGRRCLVLADGFYEWRREGRARQPFYIRLDPDRPFAFAGLWERWTKEGPPLETCTIATTEASPALASIYARMPVILEPEDYALWLEAGPELAEAAASLMRPYVGALTCDPVGLRVNSPRVDEPALIEPLAREAAAEPAQGQLFETDDSARPRAPRE